MIRTSLFLSLFVISCGGKQEPEPEGGPGSGGAGSTGSSSDGGRSPVPGSGGQGLTPAGGASPGAGGAGSAGAPVRPPPPPGEPGTVVPEPEDEASYLFDPTVIRTYNILIEPADLAIIDANPSAEQWVPARLEFEGQVQGPLMVRYKGSAGAFLRPCTASTIPGIGGGAKTGKCSIKVGFDQVDPDGRFLGLRKLNFHAMSNDRSLLRERLGYGLFRQFGIAAPRAMHARLLINGQLEGLFALVEQVDGRFTRARFTEGGEGNLYKEVWPLHDSEDTYLAALETNRSENPSASRMLDFKAAIAEGAAGVDRFLDREYTLKYVAADRVMVNDDGIFHFWCAAGGQGNNPGAFGNHNYYWYEEPGSPRLWLIAWDFDISFASNSFVRVMPEWRTPAPCSCAGFPGQMPPSCDPLMQVWASQNSEYEQYVDEFIAGPFAPERVEESIASYSAQIRDHVVEAGGRGGAPDETEWQAAVEALRAFTSDIRVSRGFPY